MNFFLSKTNVFSFFKLFVTFMIYSDLLVLCSIPFPLAGLTCAVMYFAEELQSSSMEAICKVSTHQSTGLEKTITVFRGSASLGTFTLVIVYTWLSGVICMKVLVHKILYEHHALFAAWWKIYLKENISRFTISKNVFTKTNAC